MESGCGGNVHELEMFFFGFPRIVGMEHFPRLTKLCIINQKITSMEGIESCRTLQELWVCEGRLTKIEGTHLFASWTLLRAVCMLAGLQCCGQLHKLYLYSNSIAILEGLDRLSKLAVLWLNGNKISVIEVLPCFVC